MKWIPILTLLVASVAMAAGVDVKSVADRSQPMNNPVFNSVKEWSLNPSQACTTISKDIAGLGGFSMQLWDSVKTGTGNVDTIIIRMKFQVANRDTVTAFSCEGLTDTLIFPADTLIAASGAATKKGFTPTVDFSTKVPRCGYIKYILENIGPDTCRGIRIYPVYNLSTP